MVLIFLSKIKSKIGMLRYVVGLWVFLCVSFYWAAGCCYGDELKKCYRDNSNSQPTLIKAFFFNLLVIDTCYSVCVSMCLLDSSTCSVCPACQTQPTTEWWPGNESERLNTRHSSDHSADKTHRPRTRTPPATKGNFCARGGNTWRLRKSLGD